MRSKGATDIDWLLNNPIAEMHGATFLGFYAVVIAITLLGTGMALKAMRSHEHADVPPVPTTPDPYEIAFLRGGMNELTRTIIFSLLQRGYLAADVPTKRTRRAADALRQATDPADLDTLSAGERAVYLWFRSPKSPEQVFSQQLPERVAPYYSHYEQDLRRRGLLTGPDHPEGVGFVWLAGSGVILGLGVLKLAIALQQGRHNVGFLILMAIFGTIFLGVQCHYRSRLTQRGQSYLGRLRLAYSRFNSPARTAGTEAALPLLVGVFGAAALTGTPYQYVPEMFQRATSAGSGSSCGGASCGSGGGGGGGGCGGGGCGG